jgi:hypothetical protein
MADGRPTMGCSTNFNLNRRVRTFCRELGESEGYCLIKRLDVLARWGDIDTLVDEYWKIHAMVRMPAM